MQYQRLLQQVKDFYQDMTLERLEQLAQFYDPQVSFTDPVQQIKGIEQLTRYFQHSLENVHYCRFEFLHELASPQQVYLGWQMQYAHSKLHHGKPMSLPGVSYLTFNSDCSRILTHSDYYDMGAMLYEHLPVLGWLTGKVRQRLVQA